MRIAPQTQSKEKGACRTLSASSAHFPNVGNALRLITRATTLPAVDCYLARPKLRARLQLREAAADAGVGAEAEADAEADAALKLGLGLKLKLRLGL